MNADLRAPLLVGAVAAGLSMLVGLIAHVSFFPLILRALLFGAVFGALTWGATVLLHSYVPDLFDVAGGGNDVVGSTFGLEEGADEQLGGAVDIVLDDREDGGLAAVGQGFGGSAGPARHPARASVGDEEVLDVAPMGDLTDTEAAEPPIVELAEEAEPAGAIVSAGAAGGMDDLDILPDLDALAGEYGTFDLAPARSAETFAPSHGAGGDDSHPGSSAVGTGGSDPATLAAAVRTMLKRDQKG